MAADALLGTVIVPVLNEAHTLPLALQATLAELGNRWQVVVVDGGSQDGTPNCLAGLPVTCVTSPAGRARQMNHGAHHAAGPILVFLHADTRLPAGFNGLMESFAASSSLWGRFDVQLDDPAWPYRMIAWFMNKRSRFSGVCTGDQTLFLKSHFFQQMGGYADIPLMEDVEFTLRARRASKPVCITTPVRTSARRWRNNGILKTVVLMWWLRLAFRLGVSPRQLHTWYYGRSA